MSKANTLSLGVEAVTGRDSELDCGFRFFVGRNLAYEIPAQYETKRPEYAWLFFSDVNEDAIRVRHVKFTERALGKEL